jgi:hypothetical protein
MYECSSAYTEFLHIGAATAAGQSIGEPIMKRRIAGLTDNQMLVAKIRPVDFFAIAQSMALWENNEDPFGPEGEHFATIGIGEIGNECDVELPVAESCDVIRR